MTTIEHDQRKPVRQHPAYFRVQPVQKCLWVDSAKSDRQRVRQCRCQQPAIGQLLSFEQRLALVGRLGERQSFVVQMCQISLQLR